MDPSTWWIWIQQSGGYTDMWWIQIQEPQIQIQATGGSGSDMGWSGSTIGKHKKGRQAKARDTLQGNPEPDPEPEYWIHGPPDQVDVQVKEDQGDQAPSELGSTTTRLNVARSTDRHSARRTFAEEPRQIQIRIWKINLNFLHRTLRGPRWILNHVKRHQQNKAGHERYGFADHMAKQERYISEAKDEEVNEYEDSEADGYVFSDDRDASDEARVSVGRSGAPHPTQIHPKWPEPDQASIYPGQDKGSGSGR
ncbi:unnamed protein product [Phytophthora fragariaefolia]|uniref:Unnamed protein product n=1 Tax=Phytophthora fragariaefolia TaxID=1490495 RepID=A0A9W6TS50_9STRA|nr:unnamed protein product [Phytophthora fragariaefolia]